MVKVIVTTILPNLLYEFENTVVGAITSNRLLRHAARILDHCRSSLPKKNKKVCSVSKIH
jgi:hypothetical protein